jgi:hypothetical protein
LWLKGLPWKVNTKSSGSLAEIISGSLPACQWIRLDNTDLNRDFGDYWFIATGLIGQVAPCHYLMTERGAGKAVVERAGCFANFHAYIDYKVLEFSDQTLTGVTIRRSEK